MVITSLLGSIPGIGGDILFLLWGSYSIDGVTLQRFYSLHYLIPFAIVFLVLIHVVGLHEYGSNNVLGISPKADGIPFTPYYGVKDMYTAVLFLILFFSFVIITPDKLLHFDNFVLANPLVTPPHIVPEWYFLPLYGILRSVTNKLLGIFLLAMAIIGLFLVPFLCKGKFVRSAYFEPTYTFFCWVFIAD